MGLELVCSSNSENQVALVYATVDLKPPRLFTYALQNRKELKTLPNIFSTYMLCSNLKFLESLESSVRIRIKTLQS